MGPETSTELACRDSSARLASGNDGQSVRRPILPATGWTSSTDAGCEEFAERRLVGIRVHVPTCLASSAVQLTKRQSGTVFPDQYATKTAASISTERVGRGRKSESACGFAPFPQADVPAHGVVYPRGIMGQPFDRRVSAPEDKRKADRRWFREVKGNNAVCGRSGDERPDNDSVGLSGLPPHHRTDAQRICHQHDDHHHGRPERHAGFLAVGRHRFPRTRAIPKPTRTQTSPCAMPWRIVKRLLSMPAFYPGGGEGGNGDALQVPITLHRRPAARQLSAGSRGGGWEFSQVSRRLASEVAIGFNWSVSGPLQSNSFGSLMTTE